ncbi:MAG: 1-acyl-sn-glycerol-3-phosphate acyltransferase [Actinomycetota bacterium]|nr:1-acyl-sn-glycerol-3-phosphate acyltransferase [Actinomycetota bacterium]
MADPGARTPAASDEGGPDAQVIPLPAGRHPAARAARPVPTRRPAATPRPNASPGTTRARTAADRPAATPARTVVTDLERGRGHDQADPSRRNRSPLSADGPAPVSAWERRAAEGLDFLRRRLTGEYEVDEFGFDPDLTDHVILPALRPLYAKWFRTEVTGAHNLPTDRGALLVANHAGALWALDGVMTAVAVNEATGGERYLRLLAADLVFTSPGLGPLARKGGSTLACNPDAERLLGNGELVGVWPEGFKGIGKPFRERYKLQRFGRGGFVTAALRTGVPIVPVSIVGAEEIHPMLANAKGLARVLGLPYFPITPTFPWLGPLGFVPLPSKWHIEFGEPVETSDYESSDADDPMVTFELTDRVRETIQSTLYRLLRQRSSPWS